MNLKSRTFVNLHCFLQVVEHRPPANWHGRLSTKPHWPSVPSSLLRVPLDSISVYQTMEKWGGLSSGHREGEEHKRTHQTFTLGTAGSTSDRVEEGQLPETAGSDKSEKSRGFQIFRGCFRKSLGHFTKESKTRACASLLTALSWLQHKERKQWSKSFHFIWCCPIFTPWLPQQRGDVKTFRLRNSAVSWRCLALRWL